MNRIDGNKALAEYLNISLTSLKVMLRKGFFQQARVKRSPRLVAYIPDLVDKEMQKLAKY